MALGGWFGGFLFDLSGSYVLAFILGAGANVINLVIVGMLLLRLRSVRAALIYS
jgi:cyanate permease